MQSKLYSFTSNLLQIIKVSKIIIIFFKQIKIIEIYILNLTKISKNIYSKNIENGLFTTYYFYLGTKKCNS